MTARDIDDVLLKTPRDKDGMYRGLASLTIAGDIIGPFRYYGTRSDDPNDIVDHEDRRDLRGLYVFAAWLNHTDSKSINSLDSVVEEDGRRFIKHFLIDFGAILGQRQLRSQEPARGNVFLFDWTTSAEAVSIARSLRSRLDARRLSASSRASATWSTRHSTPDIGATTIPTRRSNSTIPAMRSGPQRK